MHILRRIAVFLAVLPLLEIVIFVIVASTIGFWNAVLLSLTTSVAGAMLLRMAGRPQMRQFRSSLQSGVEFSGNFNGAGLPTVLAGFLLLIPGFLTDLVAVLLLIAPVRRLIIGAAAGSVRTQAAKPPPGVVDLDPGEWHNEPQQSLPRRPQDPDKTGPKP